MSEGSFVLAEDVRALAVREGAVLVGIADVERFDGAPRGHHPAEMVKGARSVVTFGIPLVEQVADWNELFHESAFLPAEHRNSMLQDYLYATVNYDFINDRLNQVALSLSLFLQSKGFRTLMFPATFGPNHTKYHDMMREWAGLFSQRHAAVRAGLGEFGLNNVVVTPEYGPRVRFNSVITQASVAPSPLLEEKACVGSGCMLCVDGCASRAISLLPAFDESGVWLNPVSRTNKPVCRQSRSTEFCYGRCLAVCPVGKHTSSVGGE